MSASWNGGAKELSSRADTATVMEPFVWRTFPQATNTVRVLLHETHGPATWRQDIQQ